LGANGRRTNRRGPKPCGGTIGGETDGRPGPETWGPPTPPPREDWANVDEDVHTKTTPKTINTTNRRCIM
jgi:hypothetical protein